MSWCGNDAAVLLKYGGWSTGTTEHTQPRLGVVSLQGFTPGKLAKEGWNPGPPADLTTTTIQEHQRSCARAACRRCGKQGLEYRPWHKKWFLREEYREFAACRQCGYFEEIQ